jgi:hypothetical protein
MAKSSQKAAKKTAKKNQKKAAKKAPVKQPKKAAKKKAKNATPTRGKKFLIIYHAPLDAMAQTASATPEEMAAGMAEWRAWAERVGRKMVDLGAPLVNGKRLSPAGSTLPSTREVSGYSLLQAEDWEEVMHLLAGHPHISGWHPDATIEVHETMLLPGM